MTGLKVILTGATGMVGEGVLRQCINSADVTEVLIVGRRPCGLKHEKIRELIVPDLSKIESAQFPAGDYQACFFCMGVSSLGMKEPQYNSLTYELTVSFARALQAKHPDLTFCYISGSGTDSSGKGKSMWARVKGRTENELMRLFPKSYMFRPGYMRPDPEARHTLRFYRYINWLYPVLRKVFPRFVTTLAELGQAMLGCAMLGYEKRVLEVPDIVKMAGRLKSERS